MDVNQIMNFYEILYEIYEICKPQDMKIARGPGALWNDQPESRRNS